GSIVPGQIYSASAWVTISGAAQSTINLTRKFTCDGVDDFARVGDAHIANEQQWIELTGTFAVPDCNLTDALLYVEGPAGGIDLYVDDVLLTH
ncbi:MAG: carbohydrate binding domain-containing protein, partial [Myxococcota bacterium]